MVVIDVVKPLVYLLIFFTLDHFQSHGEYVAVNVTKGGDVLLTCSLGNNQSIRWSENRRSINNSGLENTTNDGNFTQQNITISMLTVSTQFQCEVLNASNTSMGEKVTFDINVIDVPKKQAEEGKNISLSCPGSTPPTKLVLTKVTRESTKRQTCNFTIMGNYSKVIVYQVIELDVTYPSDNITVILIDGTNRLNGELVLLCKANGNPPPRTFEWFWNGNAMHNTSGNFSQPVSSYTAAGGKYTCKPESAEQNATIFVVIKGPPSAPHSLEFIHDQTTNHSLAIKWKVPMYNGNATIYTYQVNITNEKLLINTTFLTYTTNRAQSSVQYSFRVRAVNKFGYGEWSVVKKETMTVKPTTSTTTAGTVVTGDKTDTSELQTALIILGILVVLALIVAVIFGFLYLRTAFGCYHILRRSSSRSNPIPLSDVPPPSPRQRITSFSSIKMKIHTCKSDPFSIKSFQNHVRRLHRDSDYLFSQEYEAVGSKKYLNEIDEKIELECTEGQKPENATKNRYADILSYDHSRVTLTQLDDDPNSTYINASYVDGYNKPRAYIAAQGPLGTTMSDFWRMIWESNTRVVVMITNLFERSKPKCAKYWPDTGSIDHGNIQVTITKEETFANYIVRTFIVRPVPGQTHYISINDEHEPRIIQQFHFTEWPDHDVPSHAPSILRFIHKSKAANPKNAGPIVVHCSAGVGRSGTYIVIDSMMQRIDDQKTVDIFNFLNHIRTQRNFLVQEESQYIFVHDAINDYTHFGNSNIPIENFLDHLSTLRRMNTDNKTTTLKREFEAVDHTKSPEKHKWVGKKTCNTLKNRRKDVLPVEKTRVKLPPILGVEGADYINASYIDGFSKKKEYIATQAPMRTTVECFWRMVKATKCNMIIMLLSEEEWSKDDFFADLPTNEEAVPCGKLEIHLESEEISEDFAVRKLRVFSSDVSDGRSVNHYHYRNWPASGIPSDKTSLIRFIELIKNKKKTEARDAPIIVYCDFGVGRSGIFCLLSTLYDQLEEEGSIDVYQTAKLYRVQRPQFIETEEQYSLCYDILNDLVAQKLSALSTKLTVNGNDNNSPTSTINCNKPPSNALMDKERDSLDGGKSDISGKDTTELPENEVPGGKTPESDTPSSLPESDAPSSGNGTPDISDIKTPDCPNSNPDSARNDTPLITDPSISGIDNPHYRKSSASDTGDVVC